MYIISFDIASKSLAISIILINTNWKIEILNYIDLYNLLKKEDPESKKYDTLIKKYKCIKEINYIIHNIIQIKFLDVVDLTPNMKLKDVHVIDRSARLSSYICNLKLYINTNIPIAETEKVKVLLEYQMGPNDQSRNVGSQILYAFSGIDPSYKSNNLPIVDNTNVIHSRKHIYDPMIIGPTLKNKLCVAQGGEYSAFVEKYATNYTANKSHSKFNFLQWMKTRPELERQLIGSIKKKNIDDIADSVNMCIAWVYYKSNIFM
jgi:hypothetical protein